jgi:two-component system, LytTR family, sensor kinase
MITTPLNNPIIKFVAEPRFRWLRHTLFILAGGVVAFKGDMTVANDRRSPELKNAILILDGLTFIFLIAVIYFMIFVLIPKLLFRSKIFLFISSLIAIIISINIIVWWLDYLLLRPVDPENNMPHIELSPVLFIQLGIVSTVLLGAVIGIVVFKNGFRTFST